MEGEIASDYPKYLDSIFFAKCLQQGLNLTNIQIKNLQIINGTNPGDNYTSFIYRVKIVYDSEAGKGENIQLLVKSIPTDGDRAILEQMKVYSTEKYIYIELIPQVQQILNIQVAPKCYYTTDNPIQTIVLQDLLPLGYTLANRVIGLDESHLRLVLDRLGRYHAASMHLLSKAPYIKDNLKEVLFDKSIENADIFLNHYERNLKKASEKLSNMPGFEQYAPKLLTICNDFLDILFKSFSPKVGGIKVINHGDVWVNNIMFKYDDKCNPVDALLIDFSDCYVNTPALDLNCLFISSAQLNVLKRKEELIKKFYYPAFRSTLENLNENDIPSLAKLLEEVREREVFSLFIFFGDFPFIIVPKEVSKTCGFDELADEELTSKKMDIGMSTERFMEAMKYILKYFDAMNVFENAIKSMK